MAEISGRVGWKNYTPSSTNLWNGLTNYYSGDNTTNDLKGTSNATLTNGATYSIGKINNGFNFDGVNDALVLNTNPLIGGIATDLYKSFSISCWIKPGSLSGGIFNTQYVNDGYRLILVGDGRLFYRGFYSNGGYGADDIYTSNCIAIGNSYHIVVIHEDGVGTKIYCNDILVGSSSSTVKQIYSSAAVFRIGGDPIHGYMGNFNGSIDEFGLWNRAISLSEKTELYNAGAGKQYVSPTPTYTTRTAAFATATGITDATILNALNTFDTGLISNGLATKMKALYPFVGGTANTHKYNFMDARDTNSAFRLTFNGGGLHSSTGYKPNGSNAYANTFLTPSANLSPTSSHISFYSRTNVSTTQVEMGVTTNNSDYYLIEINTSGTSYFAVNNAGIVSSSDSNSLGFYVANRPSSNLINGWKNSTKITTGVNSYNPSPSILPIFIGAWNENITPMYYSTKECAFSSIGDGLTDSEATTFYTLVQALQTALSRQV
jgi:hypothetical protein